MSEPIDIPLASAQLEVTQQRCRECGKEHDVMQIKVGDYVPTLGGGLLCDECDKRLNPDAFEEASKVPQPDVDKWLELCPPHYRNVERSKLPPYAQQLWDTVVGWTPDTYEEPGLGIVGDESGQGKSMLMYALARECYVRADNLHMVSAVELAYQCGSIEPHVRNNAMRKCITAGLLFVDDLGKEKATQRVEADFYHIIEERVRYDRPIIFTTNLRGPNFVDHYDPMYGPYLHRRLGENCKIVNL